MADQTFEPERSEALFWLMLVGLGIWLGVWAVIGAGDGVTGTVVLIGVFAVVFLGAGLHLLVFEPFEVTLTEAGVVLRARARTTTIPWRELYSVRLRTGRFTVLIWDSEGRRPMRSPACKHTGHLLAEVARRSPGTTVS